jgi:flagellar basal-body rod protein FlgB
MSIIDRAFSIHDDALALRSRRTSILATNIANSDTPNYKARDMDFSAVLKQAAQAGQNKSVTIAKTHDRHLSANPAASEDGLMYRNPLQASLDGNTVDMHAEQARFSENAFQYQTSFTLLSSKIRGLLFAIKGQQ